MKTTAFLTVAIFLFCSCKKDKDPVDFKKALGGTYIGASEHRSSYRQEIFTSPNTSHFEWVNDSAFQNPDTLIIAGISADSFSIQGNVAKHLPAYWQHFAWNESPGTNSVFTFSRGLFATGYLENLSITFQPDNNAVKVDYSYHTDYNDSKRSFDGGK